MRYELMLPHHIRTAIAEDWPVVLPLGPLEYHGEHMATGMDTLVVVRTVERLEREMDLVILPAFYYGAASYAVEPPGDGKGSVQVEAEHLIPVARDIFRSLLRIGFRNIHFFIHHQSENFVQGMPTDLAFRTAARLATFEFLEREFGEGWWGSERMASYYEDHAKGVNPFNWIQGHPLMDAGIISQYPFDHAAQGETSLMLELCPEGVDMSRLPSDKWYMASATQASRELGSTGAQLVLDRMRRLLTRSGTDDG
jgi:creatinine amidohydrolase/Fe(II)-dependent formamide hydrolase-like protein